LNQCAISWLYLTDSFSPCRVFESLPEFSKFQKLYAEKSNKDDDSKKHSEQSHDDEAPGKWKMKFSKDERQIDGKQKSQTKQQFGGFGESEDEEQARNFQSHAPATATNASALIGAAGTSGYIDKAKKARSPPKPKEIPIMIPQAPVPLLVSKGPVVLDKFGNFRLADPAPFVPKLRSRSKSRRRDSRSRSYSR